VNEAFHDRSRIGPYSFMISHAAFWLDQYPKRRRPAYPQLRGDSETSVAIVGGGLTGCACAASFAAAGVRTIVVEADRVGAGSTAGALGLVREDFDTPFQSAAAAHGLRAARLLWRGMHRASLDLAAALRRFDIRCDLGQQDVLDIAWPDLAAGKLLRREYDARREAGLEPTWLTPTAVQRQTATQTGGAIRTRGFVVDPYRACIGLAAAAAKRSAQIFERSAVTRIRATRKHVDVTTARGTIRAEAVVIATASPLADLRALRRHLRPQHAYAVVTAPLPASVRREVGARTASLRDTASPPHLLRWLKDDRVFFTGGDQPPVPARARENVLVQRTGQLMYELSTMYPAISGVMPEWSWQSSQDDTVDGLPFIGTHRNFPRHLFALGSARHGAAVSWLAARILLRTFQGSPARPDELFGFGRVLS
jgi:glycine/D-amino acid oxidase-like deaminating enzyme